MEKVTLSNMLPTLLKHATMLKLKRDLLIKQFVYTLKGNNFDWYTELESQSIDSWNNWNENFSIAFIAPTAQLAYSNSPALKNKKMN